MDEPVQIDHLIHHVTELHPQGDALVHLADAVTVSERIGDVTDQLVHHFVNAARAAGATWSEIGASMGVTRQAVQKRFVPRPTEPEALDAAVSGRSTPRAQAVVAAAQEEARALGHNYIGTEHLVLGLLSQPESLGAQVLAERVTPQALRAAMSEALGPPAGQLLDRAPYTPRAKRALELTVEAADRLRHDYIGTEHILLGVLAEGLGIGARVLGDLGVDQHAVEEWLAAR
jgi:hypothetical protein